MISIYKYNSTYTQGKPWIMPWVIWLTCVNTRLMCVSLWVCLCVFQQYGPTTVNVFEELNTLLCQRFVCMYAAVLLYAHYVHTSHHTVMVYSTNSQVKVKGQSTDKTTRSTQSEAHTKTYGPVWYCFHLETSWLWFTSDSSLKSLWHSLLCSVLARELVWNLRNILL